MFEKINGRLDTTEEKISELEHESLEINQTEAQREGKKCILGTNVQLCYLRGSTLTNVLAC